MAHIIIMGHRRQLWGALSRLWYVPLLRSDLHGREREGIMVQGHKTAFYVEFENCSIQPFNFSIHSIA